MCSSVMETMSAETGRPVDDPGDPYPRGCAGMMVCLALDVVIVVICVVIALIAR